MQEQQIQRLNLRLKANTNRHHTKSFDNPGYKGETVLSTHIWELKARGSTYKVSWQGAEWDKCVS